MRNRTQANFAEYDICEPYNHLCRNFFSPGIQQWFFVCQIYRSVLDNFHSAMNAFNDPDIAAVAETLQLAQDAILSDLNQLPAQFVGRLYEVMPLVYCLQW